MDHNEKPQNPVLVNGGGDYKNKNLMRKKNESGGLDLETLS